MRPQHRQRGWSTLPDHRARTVTVHWPCIVWLFLFPPSSRQGMRGAAAVHGLAVWHGTPLQSWQFWLVYTALFCSDIIELPVDENDARPV